MRCDDALELLSAALDERVSPAVAAALEEHVDSCGACADFRRHAEQIRRELRFEVLGQVPDVAPAVLARVTAPAGRPWLPVAACFAVGLVVGALLVGPPRRAPIAAAE